MFDFDRPEDGSEQRFDDRLNQNKHPASKIKHLGWWVIHNCVAHFIMGIMPFRWTFDFHDWTSRKLNEHE